MESVVIRSNAEKDDLSPMLTEAEGITASERAVSELNDKGQSTAASGV